MKQKTINNLSDKELYVLLRGNKLEARKAFDELYTRHSQEIYTFCIKYLNDSVLAEDVFQETFTKLYVCSQDGVELSNVKGYLITIARNLCFNEANRKVHKLEVTDEILSGYDDKTFENKELGEVLNFAIDSLPDNLKEVIILREHLDMSYNEIADVLDIPLSSVRVYLYRAKLKLRNFLTPYLNDVKE